MSSGESPVDRLVSFAPAPRQSAPHPAIRSDIALTVATYVSLLVVTLPLLRVVSPAAWTIGVLLFPAIVLAVGWLARRRRLPAVAVSLAELIVGIVILTLVFLRDTALLGVVPTPRSVGEGADLVAQAIDQIVNGAAPLHAASGLEFLIVGGMLALAVVVDHVVLTARMPLLAAVALLAVWLIPSIAVPGKIDVLAFVLLAAIIFVLLRLETRTREGNEPRPARAARADGALGSGATASAAGIGAVAVVVALIAAPVFSGSVVRPGSGPGARWNSIDATLQLGDDLRRQSNSEVLRLQTTAATAPYLRVATLSEFDGRVWLPDEGRAVPLDSSGAFSAPSPPDDLRVLEATTSIQILNLVSSSAPVSYPASAIDGLTGEWGAVPLNGTIVSPSATVNGQDYQVVSRSPRPTLEQIRAVDADPADAPEGMIDLPPDLPAIIPELAAQVTEGAGSDYDELLTLQRWFRSSEFEYSLEAPVEEGFDGSGAEAIARFLDVRKGYCVHFASAFALMARSLGIPTRIVIGYLPGSAMSDLTMGDRMFSVLASQLHAWPEVYFGDLGWIPFEPTNSLGTPTSFSPAYVASNEIDSDAESTPTPTATPTAGPLEQPEGMDDHSAQASGSTNSALDALPWLGPLVGLVVALAIPAALREARRRNLLSAARMGDAAAAWRSLQESAIDLGIPVPPDESPRAFGARLVGAHGAPAEAVRILVNDIEFASYARTGQRWRGDDLAAAVESARSALMERAGRRRRVLAAIAPRSLLIRPGSVYAGDGARAHV